MRISFRPAATGAGAYTVLADEANGVATQDRISSFVPQRQRSPQVEPIMRSAAAFVADRGNSQWTLSFIVARLHDSAEDALQFLCEHAAQFDIVGSLDLKIEVGTQINFLPACAMVDFTPDQHSDQSTTCRYTFVGGSYTTTPP